MKELLALVPDSRLEEPLAPHCTMRVGGPAKVLMRPTSPAQLAAGLSWLHRRSMPFKVVGKGANLLISDAGFDGAIILLGEGFSDFSRTGGAEIKAGAGLSLASLAWQAARLGIGGFEFAAQIPGTVGGALVNNAGAYHQDWTSLVREATVLRSDGTAEVMTPAQLGLRYRHSSLKGSAGTCVLDATFEGHAAELAAVAARIQEYGKKRAASQPVSEYTAGCVFKNPPQAAAAALIDRAGLKGTTVGEAVVSPKHANFIVNQGRARCQDVVDLIHRVQETVHGTHGVTLETEVELVGFPSGVA